MWKKLLWSLMALLSSLMGFYGAVRLGWTYEVLFAAALVAAFLIIGLFAGEPARPAHVVLEAEEPPPLEAEIPPLLFEDSATPPEVVDVSQPSECPPRTFDWGRLPPAVSAGPTAF